MYDLGTKLKTIRQKRGITQKELAHRLNKSASAVSSYESNAQLPPLDVIEDIARILNVSIDYLVGTDKSYTISTRSLTPEEAELLDFMLLIFQSESSHCAELTDAQIRFLQRLIRYFVTK